jgi:L-threonylcarbamoyladenylate synthase
MSHSPFLSNCTADTIREAAAALKAGHLVAFPTETVYGLGADARNPNAVRRIYEVKGRPTDHPLIVHISSINQLEKWAIDIPDYAISLARAFWPGPMTLILERARIAEDFITGGQNTVGLRVPSDPTALALVHEFERISNSAIVAPSANRFGHVSPTSHMDVQEELSAYLGSNDQILAGGKSRIGIESTIVDCTGNTPNILRSGFVTKEDLENELGIELSVEQQSGVKFSGSFEKHYAPKCRVLVGDTVIEGAGFLASLGVETPAGMYRMAEPSSVLEFASVLYSTFRKADQRGMKELVVLPPSGDGLAVAINERLDKAARGR